MSSRRACCDESIDIAWHEEMILSDRHMSRSRLALWFCLGSNTETQQRYFVASSVFACAASIHPSWPCVPRPPVALPPKSCGSPGCFCPSLRGNEMQSSHSREDQRLRLSTGPGLFVAAHRRDMTRGRML